MMTSLEQKGVEAALRQARRARKRGRHRQEMLLLRKAAFAASENPALWNRYALSCIREGRHDEAAQAFAHSVWLDRRHGNRRRAEVTLRLADQTMGPLSS
jgi:Flp pilus assembly protein TadD